MNKNTDKKQKLFLLAWLWNKHKIVKTNIFRGFSFEVDWEKVENPPNST